MGAATVRGSGAPGRQDEARDTTGREAREAGGEHAPHRVAVHRRLLPAELVEQADEELSGPRRACAARLEGFVRPKPGRSRATTRP
jgi:hypothetical protein